MNSLPPQHRGAGSGMNTTFQNSAQVLSIGIFFTLMIVGLIVHSPRQPAARAGGPRRAAGGGRAGRPPAAGLHPVRRLPRLQPDPAPDRCPHPQPAPPAQQQVAHRPELLPRPDQRARSGHGLHAALDFAIVASLLAAGASWLRGGRYVLLGARGRTTGGADGRSARAARSSRCRSGPADDVSASPSPGGGGRSDHPERHHPVRFRSVLRIGEVAKLTGLTTRTLRYWEELGLIRPSSYRGSGERLYSHDRHGPGDPDPGPPGAAGVLAGRGAGGARHRGRRRAGPGAVGVPLGRAGRHDRRQLLDEAIEANDKLLARLDDTLARIGAFRDERAAKAIRLREARRQLDEDSDELPGRTDVPTSDHIAYCTTRSARARMYRTHRPIHPQTGAARSHERRHEGRDHPDHRRQRRQHRGLSGPASGRAADRRGGGHPPHARLRRGDQGDHPEVRRPRLPGHLPQPLLPRGTRRQPRRCRGHRPGPGRGARRAPGRRCRRGGRPPPLATARPTARWPPSATARAVGSRSWPPAASTSMPPSTATAPSSSPRRPRASR